MSQNVLRFPHTGPATSPAAAGTPSITVAHRAQITYRMLDHWVRAGYVTCAYQPKSSGRGGKPQGSGYARLWTSVEVAHVIRVADLARAGFRVDIAAALARQLADADTVRIGPALTVVEAHE